MFLKSDLAVFTAENFPANSQGSFAGAEQGNPSRNNMRDNPNPAEQHGLGFCCLQWTVNQAAGEEMWFPDHEGDQTSGSHASHVLGRVTRSFALQL